MFFRFMPPICTREMDSTPEPIATGVSSVMICCAAIAIACRPDEQKRFTVVPAVETGQPAQIAALRATFMPVAPSGWAQPMKTSSISAGSILALAMACLMAWPPITAPWVMLKPPRTDLARAVRAVETMTASFMAGSAG